MSPSASCSSQSVAFGDEMGKRICVICDHYVSEWQEYTGKTTTVNGILVHTSCLQHVAIHDLHRLRREKES